MASHSGHGGHGGGMSDGDLNKFLALTYWYLIAGVVGFLLIIRAVNHLDGWLRYVPVLPLPIL
jgi:hypothetical protein